ncbi:AT-rich interactive domain-containing protein 4A [Takifugu rubripes]|uniref:AT-rich interactive domain-containing protein 4A n=1 Tax=Takifugu rubripes TaxID=31033 RepID=UPI0011459A12|nr:AT-rich interactive domain-containing protein 4A [Takifugu rubripes]XP_029688840.1 AT-rich interactive domain-containing protein 4A [Takifugu rubripes]
MKAADEPAYLTVGTDVSAKYRGAFCEAKIKTVKRLVKVKVTLKGENTSQVVHDDQVKGLLRVGTTVEVKTNEGLSSEAVISKLTDASLYTVVFDDGDEKTLRRTSLCLKGERHFAESETLDQLPLTNPEHFGTPVIGKKTNRGGRRSSQAVADEENESSSSDDEDDDRRRLNDELLGKVCSIEAEEDPVCWYLALVVSPSCNDELLVKKDQCLVRAFSDSKFHTVARRHVNVVGSLGIAKSEFSDRKGFEAAHLFLKTREVPDVWKMDLSQILDSSSSDDDDDEEKESEEEEEEEEEEEDEKKKINKQMKDEMEEEQDPEERDQFLQQLYKFMEDRGTPINKPPVLGYKDLNLFKLFRLVCHYGGCRKIESGTMWKQVYVDLGIPVLNSAASYNVKTAYKKYLYGFEEYCRSASITFRTIHHNNPRTVTSSSNQRHLGAEMREASIRPEKVESMDEKVEEGPDIKIEKEAKERQMSPRGRRRSQLKVERESPSRPEKRGVAGGDAEEQREMRKRISRKGEDSERGSEEEDEDEDEEEEMERRRADRSENDDDDDDEDSVTGTKVRVKYGRGKTQKIYEAHIKKTDVDNGEQFYLVHYYGWNVRYDEWVKADRIIWPVEKGTKKRLRKKIKNKDELERERDELKPQMAGRPTGAKRGRPTGRGVSKLPNSEGRANGRRLEMPPSLPNGENTPRRRTRRTSGVYDSDRVSNEDSGNSSEDSETEEPPNKKLSPWGVRNETPLLQKEDVANEEEETNEVTHKMAADLTAGHLTAPQLSPDGSQETADAFLHQPEEEEPVEEPPREASVSLIHQDEGPVVPAGQEVVPTSSSVGSPPLPPLLEEHERSSLSLHRVKARKGGRESPPRITACTTSSSSTTSSEYTDSPPHSSLKRADEPLVVLHCLPSQHLPPDEATADSDTDSATEEEAPEEGSEDSSSTLNLKTSESPPSVEKRLCPERRQEGSPPQQNASYSSQGGDWNVT